LRVLFANKKLDRLEYDSTYTGGFSRDVVRSFRKRLDLIRAAQDERDFPHLGAVCYEKLKGDRRGQWSMRLAGRWRLILQYAYDDAGKIVVILDIADYHH